VGACANTALTLGPASGYNVYVLGAYSTSGNTDIQGSVAAGGNFTSTGPLSINEVPGSASPGTAGLVVGGNLTLDGGQLDNTNAGNAWVGGTVSSGSTYTLEHNLEYLGSSSLSNIVVDGTTTHLGSGAGTPIVTTFTNAATSLANLSATLAGDTVNGTVSGSNGTYTLTGSSSTLNIFDLTGQSFSGLTISAPAGSTVVVNISGSSSSFSNGGITYSGVTANDVIFNFDAATTVSVSAFTFAGSILAPDATFTGTNGALNGELIAASVSGQTAEFESGDIFNGNLGSVATPEPATWVLFGCAWSLLAALRVQRNRRSALCPQGADSLSR